MDETRVPGASRGYRVAAWIAALLLGAGVGLGVGFLVQDAWTGVLVGAAAAALIGFSTVAAARRGGRGSVEAAPPWTGDAGVKNHGGASL